MLLAPGSIDIANMFGPHETVLQEEVVPARFAPFPDSPYQPGYDWLFVYERELAAFLEPWLRPLRYELIGEKGLLCEVLSNAFYHGHKRDPELPIRVCVVVGEKGLGVTVEDSGPGFEVDVVIKRFFAGRTYFSSAGNGLRLMAESSHFAVCFNATGNAVSLLYSFGPPPWQCHSV